MESSFRKSSSRSDTTCSSTCLFIISKLNQKEICQRGEREGGGNRDRESSIPITIAVLPFSREAMMRMYVLCFELNSDAQE